MNVTAKHGQAAVHLGGRDMGNGRWSPLCRIQHHSAGGREVTPLRPTDKPVDCKRCLKIIAKSVTPVDDHAAAAAAMRTDIDTEEEERAAARRARNRTNYAPKTAPKVKRTEKSGMDSLRDMLKLY